MKFNGHNRIKAEKILLDSCLNKHFVCLNKQIIRSYYCIGEWMIKIDLGK